MKRLISNPGEPRLTKLAAQSSPSAAKKSSMERTARSSKPNLSTTERMMRIRAAHSSSATKKPRGSAPGPPSPSPIRQAAGPVPSGTGRQFLLSAESRERGPYPVERRIQSRHPGVALFRQRRPAREYRRKSQEWRSAPVRRRIPHRVIGRRRIAIHHRTPRLEKEISIKRVVPRIQQYLFHIPFRVRQTGKYYVT